MPKITIGKKEIMGGWGLDFSTSNSSGIEGNPNEYSKSRAISLFRLGRIGQIAPGETFTAFTDTTPYIDAMPINGIVDSDGEGFSILKNGKVVQFSIGGATIDSVHDTSAGANLVGEDILAYKNNTTEYVLYSHRDDTNWNIGRRTRTGNKTGTWADNYLTASGTQTGDSDNGSRANNKSNPHKMKVGPDGNVYFTNGQYVGKLDINTDAVDYQALNLGVGFISTGLELFGDYLVVVGYQATTFINSFSKGESRAWFWDTTTPDKYQLIFDLQDNYTSGVLATNNLFVFTSGRNGTTKAKFFNGSNFETIFESAQIGNPPKQGSIDLFQNMLHFGEDSGEKLMCLDGNAFHCRTVPTIDGETTPSDLGMVKNLSTNVLYVGRDKGSGAYDIVKINHSGYYKDADFRSIIKSLPLKSTITKVTIFFSQFGTGASIRFSLFKGYKTLSIGGADDYTNKTLTNSTLGDISSRSFKVDGAIDIDTFYFNIRFNHTSATNTAAIIRKVDIHYEIIEKF